MYEFYLNTCKENEECCVVMEHLMNATTFKSHGYFNDMRCTRRKGFICQLVKKGEHPAVSIKHFTFILEKNFCASHKRSHSWAVSVKGNWTHHVTKVINNNELDNVTHSIG